MTVINKYLTEIIVVILKGELLTHSILKILDTCLDINEDYNTK